MSNIFKWKYATFFTISENSKSILTIQKVFCPDTGRMEERYFVYKIVVVSPNKTLHQRLTNKDHPDCTPFGIKSLRKAKAVHLLNSI